MKSRMKSESRNIWDGHKTTSITCFTPLLIFFLAFPKMNNVPFSLVSLNILAELLHIGHEFQ